MLRDQITEEVNRDAEVISTQLFGSSAQGREPDLERVSDQDLQTLYRQKYLDNDRPWLQGEARRDPLQFTKVARSIGVVLPEEVPHLQPSPATLPQGPLPPAGVSAPGVPMGAPAMPMAPPAPVPPMVDPNVLASLQGAVPGPVAAAPQPIVPQMVPPQY